MDFQPPQYFYQQQHPSAAMLPHQHSHAQLAQMQPYPPMEYMDFPPNAAFHEEYDESQEVLSRPRLTKEQVEVLESQFQAHPKPNSNVKRQLAIQTKLTLPRVANWFQNRRAKAKQQKKQEEFESRQASGNNSDNSGLDVPQPTHPYPASANTNPSDDVSVESQKEDESPRESQASLVPSSRTTSPPETQWATLQLALASAQPAHAPYANLDDAMSIPRATVESPPQASDMGSSHDGSQFPSSNFSDWTNPSSTDWNSGQSDHQFDYTGLTMASAPTEMYATNEQMNIFPSSPDPIPQASEPRTEGWVASVQNPVLETTHNPSLDETLLSQSIPLPAYPPSRRGSSQDDLAASLGNIGLAGMSSTPVVQSPRTSTPTIDAFPRRETSVDIAARRKKPRPAMIGTAALRSRSYGAPPSQSPTFRFGAASHPLRHVQSTGNNLNVNYSGIRKQSMQKSPLNISTFAEAEALNAVVAATSIDSRTSSIPARNMSLSPEDQSETPMPITATRMTQVNEHMPFGTYAHLDVVSPPSTPSRAEYFAQTQLANMAPPMSAPAHYSVFPDYTPPYSAGPLTAGSWSDAPLTSPDQSSFLHHMNMAQPSYVAPMIHDLGSCSNFSHALASPTELRGDAQRSTEFYVQEFPQQKETHAQIAQQMTQQRPKNYVFANATAHDFSE